MSHVTAPAGAMFFAVSQSTLASSFASFTAVAKTPQPLARPPPTYESHVTQPFLSYFVVALSSVNSVK